ncbi:MAG: nitroreductase family protein [Clostridia bacterium]|nr:nitroreductase family protein [Clostridia bacterium]
MTELEAVKLRHSVRKYLNKPLSSETLEAIKERVALCNRESGLAVELNTDEKGAFGGFKAKYGGFENVRYYLAVKGLPSPDLYERAGYYGEQLVLFIQRLGLNTCWSAGSHSKRNCPVPEGEKLVCTIALGYGQTQGKERRSKPLSALYRADIEPPAWFLSGVEAAALAPTAINQQRFRFVLESGRVRLEDRGGPFSKIDLGIVRYHFELGSGKTLDP